MEKRRLGTMQNDTARNSNFVEGIDFKGHMMKFFHNLSTNKLLEKSTICMTPILSEKVTSLQRKYSLAEVADHCQPESCWLVLSDRVYDVTEFLALHPGGSEIILENAGTDATVPFESKGHSDEAYKLMEQYCIGELVEGDRRYKLSPK